MQHTAVSLLKTSWEPSSSWNFVPLDLFCFHCRRSWYIHGIRFLQLCPGIGVSILQTIVGVEQRLGKKIQLEEEPISEILVADNDSESGAEASDGENDFKEEEEEEPTAAAAATTTTKTANLSISWPTGCNKWRIINVGTTSRKEHKYSSFCWSNKRCVKEWWSTHQQRQLTTVCVDVFHRNFSSAGGTEQCILPATLRRTSQT